MVRTTGYNEDGTTVIEFKRTVMVYKKEHAPRIARPFFEEEREQGQRHRTTDPSA